MAKTSRSIPKDKRKEQSRDLLNFIFGCQYRNSHSNVRNTWLTKYIKFHTLYTNLERRYGVLLLNHWYTDLGSTLQSDGDMSTEVNNMTQRGWNNWRKTSGVLCNKRVPPHVKGKLHKMIVQPAMLYGMETVPVISSHVKKLKVTEMKMCRWACGHTRRDRVRNDDTGETLKDRCGLAT